MIIESVVRRPGDNKPRPVHLLGTIFERVPGYGSKPISLGYEKTTACGLVLDPTTQSLTSYHASITCEDCLLKAIEAGLRS